MPDDSLPRIAILGAGPIGLEAALYARYLGYQVQLFERGPSPATNVLDWGHVTLFTPFAMNATSLGVAALQAQDAKWQAPSGDAYLTGAEFHEQYLLRLAKSDLLVNCIHYDTEVVAVGRVDWLKREGVGDEERGESPFSILVRSLNGKESQTEADVVIDCTGTYGNHNWLGQGGIPAVGETHSAEHIEYGLPDVLGQMREQYEQKRVLVVGAGYSAATTVVSLSQLEAPVTWVTRGSTSGGPIKRIPGDRLAGRDALAEQSNTIATNHSDLVKYSANTTVQAISYQPATQTFEVTFSGEIEGAVTFDRIIANVGYHPDGGLYRELQVHECYATGGPMKLAAQLLRSGGGGDCLDQSVCGPESLRSPEPNFYILGSKSYGRRSDFLLSVGLEQIREVFTIIGERDDLDIYSTMPALS